MDIELQKAVVHGAATVISAVIVAGVGTWIAQRFARQRDREVREKEWIDQATALTRLDIERKMNTWSEEEKRDIRPPILDFWHTIGILRSSIAILQENYMNRFWLCTMRHVTMAQTMTLLQTKHQQRISSVTICLKTPPTIDNRNRVSYLLPRLQSQFQKLKG